MSHEELLVKEGAYYFGNRLIYRNQDVGYKPQGGDLVLTAEGEQVYARLSDITDVVVKPSRKKAAAPKAEADVQTLNDDLSALLGE